MESKVCLVTAFFRLPDHRVSEGELFRRFDQLASGDVPIILFLDAKLAQLGFAPQHSNVRVFPLDLEVLRPFIIEDENPRSLPDSCGPNDTRDSLCFGNSKIDFMELATRVDEKSSHFAWIDFDVMKIVRDSRAFLKDLRLLNPPTPCVLAPGPRNQDKIGVDVLSQFFHGDFLLCDRTSISELSAAHRELFDSAPKLTWEVNIWAEINRQRVVFFDWYRTDHDDSIIDISRSVSAPARDESRDVEQKYRDDKQGPRVCLTMIVKNEAAIIDRCLTAALPFIDTWCITDTGSTDGTPELIQSFFERHGVPGAISTAPFHDFSQARNDSLSAAKIIGGWDYALLIDADMVLEGTLNKSELTGSAYNILQRNGNLDYWNTRLVRRDSGAKYIGVTHEYISVEGVQRLEGLTFDDRNDGGSKGDKGPRDIRLLEEALAVDPSNERYLFYLAQVYRDMGRHQEAIDTYKKRIDRGGWDEEIWASYYGIARSHRALSQWEHFVAACLAAYNYRPGRGESLQILAQAFRETSQNDSAFVIAEALSQIPYPGDTLFVERDAYDFAADREKSIAGFWSKVPKYRQAGYEACARLTTHSNQWIREEALKNFTHYAKSASEVFGASVKEISWKPELEGWAPMNPSVFIGDSSIKRRYVLVRTVNYKVSEGNYPTNDGSGVIRTKNYILEMNENWEPTKSIFLEDATERKKNAFPVEGFEDCRLWSIGHGLCVSTTVRDMHDNPNGHCEMAIVALDENYRAQDISPIRDYEYSKTQKNWMPIVGQAGDFLYLCDPTVIIRTGWTTGHQTYEEVRRLSDRCLVALRGGSQVIPYAKGWLCVTHEVTWRPERVYLHRFVYLDAGFKITHITEPFYFKQIGIEFCAGLALDGERLVASFGVNDASAHLAFFDQSKIDNALQLAR